MNCELAPFFEVVFLADLLFFSILYSVNMLAIGRSALKPHSSVFFSRSLALLSFARANLTSSQSAARGAFAPTSSNHPI